MPGDGVPDLPAFECQFPAEDLVLAGLADDFCAPTELATPGVAIGPSCAGSVDFDEVPTDQPFCHTISPIQAMASGVLQVRIRAGSSGAECNDVITLQATGSSPTFAWTRRLGTGGPAYCDGPEGLLPTQWGSGATQTFEFDLSALPNADGSTTNLLGYVNATGRLDVRVADDSGVDYVRLHAGFCPDELCTPPPPGLVGWWPLDEATGSTAHDLALRNHGTIQGDTTHVLGKVGSALLFPGTSNSPVQDAVRVPHVPAYALQDFTLDAWVNIDSSLQPVSGNTIVNKPGAFRVMGTVYPQVPFHVHLGPQSVRYDSQPGFALPDTTWTHLAVVREGDFVSFYVDGAFWSVAITDEVYDTSNTQPFYIGGPDLNGAWGGMLDEVELFDRALDETEIAAIADAGRAGKCKYEAYATVDFPFCGAASSTTVGVKACNPRPIDEDYFVALAPLPAGAGCDVAGPPGFTVLDPNPVEVPAGECKTLLVEVERPAGIQPLETACYEVTVANLTTGDTRTVTGRVRRSDLLCPSLPNDDHALAVAVPVTKEFDIENIDSSPRFFDYEFRAVAPGSGAGTAPIRLDGLPEGSGVSGGIQLGPSESAVLTVEVVLTAFRAFEFYDLVLLADLDDDGNVEEDEVLATMGLRGAVPSLASVPALGRTGIGLLVLLFAAGGISAARASRGGPG